MRGESSCTGAECAYEASCVGRWYAYVAHMRGVVGEGVGVLGERGIGHFAQNSREKFVQYDG